MFRVSYGRHRWRNWWPRKRKHPTSLHPQFCKHCGVEFVDGPMPQPLDVITRGNVVAAVYPSGGWRKGECVVRFGRWKAPYKGHLQMSEFVPHEDLDDLLQVAALARGFTVSRGHAARDGMRIAKGFVSNGATPPAKSAGGHTQGRSRRQ
jgi:hypothetical protein